MTDTIKPGETVCEHNNRPFECKECYNLFHQDTTHEDWGNEGGASHGH